LAGFEQREPDAIGGLRRQENLESILARIPGARDGGANARDLTVREPVILKRRQLDGGEGLDDVGRSRALNGDEAIARAGVDCDRVAD